jgi:uncharacterized lipoprotein YajG
VKKFIPLIAILALGACSAQETANVISGAQTACKDEATGVVVVAATDPSLVSHNAATVNKVTAACAAINAIPAPAVVAPPAQ